MMQRCEKCRRRYDDAEAWTLCPHKLLMPRRLLEQKKAALKLAETGRKMVLVDGEDETPRHIVAIGWSGLITLSGLDEEFRPDQLQPA